MAIGLALALSPTVAAAPQRDVEVVVTLDAPPLARALASSQVLTYAARTGRLDLSSRSSVSYLDALAAAQRVVAGRIARAIPHAVLRWRYGVVANGFAVVVPAGREQELGRIPGVARVYPSIRYHSLLDRSPQLIGAPALWGPNLSTAGNGVKIGIIDDGLDQAHPFFSGAGFSMPPGFPKGQAAFTTSKVIAARAFPPRAPKWRYAGKPFDPSFSEHATHVAGIAAGIRLATAGRRQNVSGVAPNAYLGNYKVLTIPTEANVGLDGNAPEIVAGIEAAVRDGMDVINLSLGEPEVEPSRDLVVKAINAAADAGVVPAIAAGNDFQEFGRGTIGSPGTASQAITAAAATKARRIADFSSAGPTPLSLQLKPDVTAPGVDIYSSIPPPDLWASFSGTSMASPHVAGAAALLRERHPGWTVAQIKSALVETGDLIYADAGNSTELPPTRQGGGMIDLPRANNPLVFTSPTSFTFGFLRPGESTARTVSLVDAGGGAGTWAVSVDRVTGDPNVSLQAPAIISVPGALELRVAAAAGAQGEVSGFVVLTRGAETRRIPLWLRVVSAQLGAEPHATLKRTGTYRGNSSGKRSLVDAYRYPDAPAIVGVRRLLLGPEQVFRFRLSRRVANFGVAVLSQARGVDIEPRIVSSGDENRLTGYDALPVNLNPYLSRFFQQTLVSGTLIPSAGTYDIVFDSATPSTAGAFRFRFWVDDRTPPRARLLTRSLQGGSLRVAVRDAGSGVDGELSRALIDGEFATVSYRSGVVTVKPRTPLKRGRHRLVIRVSDYQETKNNENVGPILPNSRRLSAHFTVR